MVKTKRKSASSAIEEPFDQASALEQQAGIRVARTSDEVYIIIAQGAGNFEAFYTAAFDFFYSAPERLLLDKASVEAIRKEESKNFREAMRRWKRDGMTVPAQVDVTYTSLDAPRPKPVRPKLPPPLPPGDAYSVIGGLERRGISAFVLRAGDSSLETTDRGIAYRHNEETGNTLVTLVPEDVGEKITVEKLALARKLQAELSPLDEDILEVLVSNVLENPPDANGLWHITPDAVLDARGLAAKSKVRGEHAKRYSAGHRASDRAAIVDAIFNRARNIEITTSLPRKDARGREIVTRSFMLFVEQRDVVLNTGEVVDIAYRFGDWFDRWREQRVALPRRVLEYDPYRAKLAKDLARYFAQRIDENAGRQIVRRIATLMSDLSAPIDYRNPSRMREKFESTLTMLKKDNILAQWRYLEDPDDLPLRGWVEMWLKMRIEVTMPRDLDDPLH